MLDTLSNHLARKLKRNNPDVDLELIEYGIAMKLNWYGVIFLTTILGLMLHQLLESLFALFCLTLLRRYSGGIHFKSLTICMFMTSITCTIIPLISLSKWMILILNVCSLILTLFRAPNWFEELAIEKPYKRYKFISLVIVAMNFLFHSSIMAIAFFIQTLTLLPLKGEKEIEKKYC
ncbi:accessory gene regulator ArgB-like protein [Paenibacillus sp. 1001270B_150601_E10]|uniref:accessory gene regulator ArgB-like protein n=1 Tax=Paenibacillus sp. 1001270B_150601_E10 TaxID=2787079 RepID=UPI003B63BB2C